MPISRNGTLQQYAGRLHRLHHNKRFVHAYDYVDHYVPMLARMYERRLKGHSTIEYVVEREASRRPMRLKLYRGRNEVRLLGYSSTACHFFCNYLFALRCETRRQPESDSVYSAATWAVTRL